MTGLIPDQILGACQKHGCTDMDNKVGNQNQGDQCKDHISQETFVSGKFTN